MSDAPPAARSRAIDRLRAVVAYLRSANGGWSAPFRGPGRLPEVIAWGAGVACVLALWHRFHLGVDFSDEGFSIAMPYRIVRGDKPFVDEVSIQQTAGFLVVPFIWLYVKIRGGTTGLVLFVRGLTLLFKGLAALSVYAAGRRWLQYRSSAIAVAFVAFAFVPHSIPNAGYNVLGMSMLTAGTFLSAAALATDRPDPNLLLFGGIAHGLTALAYPPWCAVPVLASILIFALAKSHRFASFGWFVAGGLVVALVTAPALLPGGVAGLRRALSWGVHGGEHHIQRLWDILRAYENGAPSLYGYAFAALVAARMLRSRALVVLAIPVITVAFLHWFHDEEHSYKGPIHIVTFVATCAPLLLVTARPDERVWRGAIAVIVPGIVAGFAAGYFSTQDDDAIALGFYCMTVLFAMLAARSLERASADRTFCMFPACALMFVLVRCSYDFSYREAPVGQLITDVTAGPFKGIKTTPARAQEIAELVRIARTYDRPGARVLVLYENPALYLFFGMRPAANSVWEVPYYAQETQLEYYRAHYTRGGITLWVKGSGRGALVDDVAAPAGHKAMETPHFIVYQNP